MAVKVKERKGAWWIVIRHQGRCKWKRVGVGKEGKRAAHTASEKIAAKLALGDTIPLHETREKPLTFAAHAERWLTAYVAVHLKPSTQEMYETALRKHWVPTLGSLPLSAITREHVKTRLGEMLTAGLRSTRAARGCGWRTA